LRFFELEIDLSWIPGVYLEVLPAILSGASPRRLVLHRDRPVPAGSRGAVGTGKSRLGSEIGRYVTAKPSLNSGEGWGSVQRGIRVVVGDRRVGPERGRNQTGGDADLGSGWQAQPWYRPDLQKSSAKRFLP